MLIGIQTAQIGRLATGAAVRNTARAAEQLGYASIWVMDRLPAPIEPRSAYPHGTGALPPEQHAALDPLAVLAASASVTSQIRLGASVLVAPWYRPVLLARALTSLDVLSDGRLTVGLGLGWSIDEYDAVAVPEEEAGDRFDEALDVLDAHWGPTRPASSDGPPERVRFDGPGGRLDAANTLVPVQRPRPPVLLAAAGPLGLARVGRWADGWTTSVSDLGLLSERWAAVVRSAEAHGRDPGQLRFVARAYIRPHDRPLEGARQLYEGSVDQVAEDLALVRRVGVDEVVLGLHGDPSMDQALDTFARIAEACEQPGPFPSPSAVPRGPAIPGGAGLAR